MKSVLIAECSELFEREISCLLFVEAFPKLPGFTKYSG